MTKIMVRQEHPDDRRAIDVVNLAAFEGEDEAFLVTALRQSPAYIPELSLVAEVYNRIVGHIMLTQATLERAGGGLSIYALAPMSVVPSQSHRGIGSDLVRAAATRAAALGGHAIAVVGHPAYYQRLGFAGAKQYGVRCELPVATEMVSVMELKTGSLAQGGVLRYPATLAAYFERALQVA